MSEFNEIDTTSVEIAVETESTQVNNPINGFAEFGLAPELMAALADMNFTAPTPVQQKVLPLAMGTQSGDNEQFQDLMVSSQTGSGKTAAFLLPVLQGVIKYHNEQRRLEKETLDKKTSQTADHGEEIKKEKRRNPRDSRNFRTPTPYALVMCPTRELAQQVAQDAVKLMTHCKGLRVASVVGGMPYQVQVSKLQNANIVVATPGRLLDLQRSMQLKLDQVKFLVLDEADRLLDLGFAEDLADIDDLTRGRSQTMMFSATFSPRVQTLAAAIMTSPMKVETSSQHEKHANITQQLYWADNMSHKRKLLDHLLRDTSIDQAIVFASTQVECDGLARDLQENGFSAEALHGALSQGMRNRRLASLRAGKIQFLVATDVAARGIDVPTISHVFNYGLPMKVEDYTHRIGRTGRAGRDGLAITLSEVNDRRKIFAIEAFTKQSFAVLGVDGLELRSPVPRRGDRSTEKRGGGSTSFRGGRENEGRRGGFGGGSRDGSSSFRGRGSPGSTGENRSWGANRSTENDGGGRRSFGGAPAPRTEDFRTEPRRSDGRPARAHGEGQRFPSSSEGGGWRGGNSNRGGGGFSSGSSFGGGRSGTTGTGGPGGSNRKRSSSSGREYIASR